MDKTVYTFAEASQAALEYFSGDELASSVWVSKYALKDGDGNIYEKTPADMHSRLAREIARVESKYPNAMSEEQLFELFDRFRYIIPQGSPMTGIGNDFQIASLSNCFVIGLEGNADSYGAIIRIDEEQVQLMKRRGGVGHDLSSIRPKGSHVNNSALTSTGLVSFMDRYSNSTREVAQDGRRGALMLSVSIKHPDAASFIHAKADTNKVTGANISIKLDDEFMNAVLNNATYRQQYPINSPDPLVSKDIEARGLWKQIIHNAWRVAEPGVLFWDTILRESVADTYSDLGFRTVSTNPCGEIPLCTYDSCRLLAINLYAYVVNPFAKDARFDFELFRRHANMAQRIMDDIIDLEAEKIDRIIEKIESDPEDIDIKSTERRLWDKIRRKTLMGRRTGLGITAEGDMLAALNLRYGTEEATAFAEEVQKTLALSAYRASVEMAAERGAFQMYDHKREENNPFIKRIREADPELYELMIKQGRRNIACLTIAPTGSTSIMTQTTSGIEPVYSISYKRRRKVNPNDQSAKVSMVDSTGDAFEEFTVFHHKFVSWMEAAGISTIKSYSAEEIDDLLAKSPYNQATANNVNWLEKVRMQGRIQKWVDHSISVTINLPNDTSEELVEQLYIEAWKCGCKGCTVYRDGSRSGILISDSDKSKDKTQEAYQIAAPVIVEKRPRELEADVVKFQNNKEKWIAFIGLLNGKPYEIFTGLADDEEGIYIPKQITKGTIIKSVNERGEKRYNFQYHNKRGHKTTIDGLDEKFSSEFWNYAKLISGVIRYGMPINQVVKIVQSFELDHNINSWASGVGRALSRYIPNGLVVQGDICPICHQESLIYQEGCKRCTYCGNAQCG
ncbi:MAG: adenosylcobalamin-dependent ribonucleoside-diphosphate reductase [Tannerellaceae bacterium]|jgi:ribonucleoside-diphosphate reductase alpha chain|nr:adenosylcobalamin-dependent ribonucleoside-diphosphate reductase [Tannerellaceae bacterium]